MKHCFGWRDAQDASYRRTTTRIGVAMLIMLAFFYGVNPMVDFLSDVLLLRVNAEMRSVIRELVDSAAYLLSFMLPALFLRMMTPANERTIMPTSPKLPQRLWLLLPAGLAVICAASTANAVILDWLGFTSGSGFHVIEGVRAYEGVLLLLSSALVPAFCEEFLFRGAVLSALLPYGKTTAVLGSAVLFGLMHQNAGQFLYTSVAGVVLALLVLESGSIWSSVLLHMFNNLFMVAQDILLEQMGQPAKLWICILEILVIGGGLLCLTYLVATDRRRRDVLRESEEQPAHAVRGFFTLPMAVYSAICIGQMILIILLTKWLSI